MSLTQKGTGAENGQVSGAKKSPVFVACLVHFPLGSLAFPLLRRSLNGAASRLPGYTHSFELLFGLDFSSRGSGWPGSGRCASRGQGHRPTDRGGGGGGGGRLCNTTGLSLSSPRGVGLVGAALLSEEKQPTRWPRAPKSTNHQALFSAK